MANLEKMGVFIIKSSKRLVNIGHCIIAIELEGRLFYTRYADNSVEHIFIEACPMAVETIINRQNFNRNYDLIIEQSEIVIRDAFNAFLNFKMMQRCIKDDIEDEKWSLNWFFNRFGKNRDQI